MPTAVQKLRAPVAQAVRQLAPRLTELARRIHAHPELGFQEFQAAQWLAEFLRNEGFTIETKLAGLPTAFRARRRLKQKAPTVALLAEMDALPGLGHACGHNLIAASSAGAAAALARSLPRTAGTIEVIGCPAEESGGGKVILARAGVFDGLDAALLVHPATQTEVYKLALAMIAVDLDFFGRAAHAAAEPERGINALDAAILTFNAVNAARQHLPDSARVHGIITDGGRAPNIIPDRSAARFLARGLTMPEAEAAAKKIVACAKGAALATGARVKIKVHRKEAYEPFTPNRALGEVFRQSLSTLRIPIEQGPEALALGSTDVGNVSQRCPTLHPTIAMPGITDACHSPGFAKAAGGEAGMREMLAATEAMALTAGQVMLDPALRKKISAEFKALHRKAR